MLQSSPVLKNEFHMSLFKLFYWKSYLDGLHPLGFSLMMVGDRSVLIQWWLATSLFHDTLNYARKGKHFKGVYIWVLIKFMKYFATLASLITVQYIFKSETSQEEKFDLYGQYFHVALTRLLDCTYRYYFPLLITHPDCNFYISVTSLGPSGELSGQQGNVEVISNISGHNNVWKP